MFKFFSKGHSKKEAPVSSAMNEAVNTSNGSKKNILGNYIDMTKKKFGDYIVTKENGRDGSGHVLWECVCVGCGDKFSTTAYELNSGRKNVMCPHCMGVRASEESPWKEEPSEATTEISTSESTAEISKSEEITPTPTCYEDFLAEDVCGCVDPDSRVSYHDQYCDLLTVPPYYFIAHCLPADRSFYGELADKINKFYNLKDLLDWFYEDIEEPEVGEAVCLRNVFTLFPNPRKHTKPTLESLRACVWEMAVTCFHEDITYLAMPEIGCGHNGLEWKDVKQMILDVFSDVYDGRNQGHINLKFCHLAMG